MEAEVRAQLVAVAAEAMRTRRDERWRELVGAMYETIRDLFVEIKPDYWLMLSEAAIDALGIEDLGVEEIDVLTGQTYPTFRLGVLSLPPAESDT